MKLTAFIIIATTLKLLAAESYSQAARLNINMGNSTVLQVLNSIEQQSDFYFLYSTKLVDVNREVSVAFEDVRINDVLAGLFEDTDVDFLVMDKQIILSNKELLGKYNDKESTQPERTVTGNVTDEAGNPLIGVTVVVKGTTIGATTDVNGSYEIEVPEDADMLVFSFIGMETQEIFIGDQSVINIYMEPALYDLEEVVAIGYGTMRKANLTGSVGRATAERLENRPIVSAGQGLQGVIPNLNIEIRNGDPNTPADFNVRGFESITGGSPLILVDGIPMDLESINPNDIKSVSVLKDAASAAIYGARAAFGVILVETKSREGKVNVTLSTEQSLAKPIWFLKPITNPHQYILERNKASIRTNGVPQYDEQYVEGTLRWVENPTDENAWEVVNGVLRFYGNSDYQNKVLTDFAPQNQYDLNISGSTELTSYYVSFGFLNKDGYLRNKEKNENFERYNILAKVDFQITDWLNLSEKVVFNSRVTDKPHNSFPNGHLRTVARFAPTGRIKFPDLPYYLEPGDHEEFEQYIGRYFEGTLNWLPYIEYGGRTTFATNDTWFSQGITLTPFKGLMIKGDFSYRTYWRDYQDVVSNIEMIEDGTDLNTMAMTLGFTGEDYVQNQFDRSQEYVFNIYGEYKIDQFEDHYFKAMIGFNQEGGSNNMVRAHARDLLTPAITDLNATSGPQQTWGSKSHFALRGVFSRLNYIYKDKYLFEFNGRYDGSSRFPKDSRFGFFPSVSFGWRVSNEPFMEGSRNWLDNLKIRVSYGKLGNQLVQSFSSYITTTTGMVLTNVTGVGTTNYYPYISTMGSGMSPFTMGSGFTPYVSASGLVSPGLTWETVATQNLGVDIIVLNHRLDVSFDVYIRDTKDMLMNVSYPGVLGTSAPAENAANLRNKGWELSVNWNDRIGQNWRYGLIIGLSDRQAEITKYENPTGNFNDFYVGKKIGEIWGFKTVGIFQSEEEVPNAADQSQIGSNWRPGDIHYADLDGDGIITRGSQTLDDPGDLTIIGNESARYSFGINPEVSYKSWTLNIFFQGLFRDNLPSRQTWNAFYPYLSSIVEEWYPEETWSEDNRDAYFPAPHIATNVMKNYQPQSRWVQNAAYIRLKNLSLNYNLPLNLISKVGVSRARVYFSGMNLWEYTKMHKPLDPECIYNTEQEYYKQRIYALGFNITF